MPSSGVSCDDGVGQSVTFHQTVEFGFPARLAATFAISMRLADPRSAAPPPVHIARREHPRTAAHRREGGTSSPPRSILSRCWRVMGGMHNNYAVCQTCLALRRRL